MKWLLFAACACFALSCHPVHNAATRYYSEHEHDLQEIEAEYARLYSVHPFSIGYLDRRFRNVSFEVMTDSMKYSFQYPVESARLRDTIARYGFDTARILGLAARMRAIKCLWLNKSDYYADDKRRIFTYISIKPVAINMPFTDIKYYQIIYFDQPQKFTRHGRLVSNHKFSRINDKVCFAFSEKFRN